MGGCGKSQPGHRPERGYDDPTAHCFVGGVPRSLYVPAPVHIFQTPDAVVFLHERMAWRIVSLDRKEHLPDTMRLWQGDSIGRWEGDTLVVETKNLNGKTWLNEVGDVISHAATVVERFTPVNADRINYQATVTDLDCVYAPVDDRDAAQPAAGRNARGGVPGGQPGPEASEGSPGRVSAPE